MSTGTSSNQGKRKVPDDDDFDDSSFSVTLEEADYEDTPRIPLAAKGKGREADREPLQGYLDVPDELHIDPKKLSALPVSDNNSDVNTPSLSATCTDEKDGDNSTFEDTLASPAEVPCGIAISAESWASKNIPLLQEYRERQIDPPPNHRLKLTLSERSVFIKGFLSQLSERPSPLMSVGGGEVTGSTESLDGFVDIHSWAKEYLRRIGQGQADDLVSVMYVIMANVFYDCHLDLVDSITTRALESMRASLRTNLKIDDFALSYDLGISQTFPFGVRAGSAIEKAITALHNDRAGPPPQMLHSQQETRSGRKVSLTSKGIAYYKNKRGKVHKTRRARATAGDVGPPSIPEHSSADRLSSTIPTVGAPSISISYTGPSIAGTFKDPVGSQTPMKESADIHQGGSTPLNFHSICPNCGHATNCHVSPRTGLLSVASWKPLANSSNESYAQLAGKQAVAAVSNGRRDNTQGDGVGGSRGPGSTGMLAADSTAEPTFQPKAFPIPRPPTVRGNSSRHRRGRKALQRNEAPEAPGARPTDAQQIHSSFPTSTKNHAGVLKDQGRTANLPDRHSTSVLGPPRPSTAGRLGKIKIPPRIGPPPPSRTVPGASGRSFVIDDKASVIIQQPADSESSQREVTTLSGWHDFTFKSALAIGSSSGPEVKEVEGPITRSSTDQNIQNPFVGAADSSALTLNETSTISDKGSLRISRRLMQQQLPSISGSQQSNSVSSLHQVAQTRKIRAAGASKLTPLVRPGVDAVVVSQGPMQRQDNDDDKDSGISAPFSKDQKILVMGKDADGKIHNRVAEAGTNRPQSSASNTTAIVAAPPVVQSDIGPGGAPEPPSLRRSLRPRKKRQKFE